VHSKYYATPKALDTAGTSLSNEWLSSLHARGRAYESHHTLGPSACVWPTGTPSADIPVGLQHHRPSCLP